MVNTSYKNKMLYEKVQESVSFIKSRTNHTPTVGIILGSGLGALVDIIEDKDVIAYSEIPGFPIGSLAGHTGELVIGKLGGKTLIAMSGRFHYYEGFSMQDVTYPIYVMKLLGVNSLIVTNACGGINKDFTPGDLMIIEDYINILGINPLIGPNDERFGPRFPDMSEAYSKELIAKAEAIAENLGINYKKGVYAIFNGPSYETAAEIRAFAVMGADAIGMSTVPETTVANYLGMKVFGLSCITNMATGIASVKHTHEEVLRIANESSQKLCTWVKELIINL